MKRIFSIFLLLGLLIPSTSWAQFPALEFSAMMGYSDGFGDDAKDLKLDGKLAAGGAIDLRVAPLFSVGIGAYYMDMNSDAAFIDSFTASQVEARVKMYVPTMGVTHGGLYGLVAIGKHWGELEEDLPLIGRITAKNDGFFASLGVGLSVMVVPNFALGVEARGMLNTWHDAESGNSDHSLDVDDLHYWGVMGTATFILPVVGK